MSLERLSATELGALVNSKQISAQESIDYFLKRVSKYNNKLTAFVYLEPEDAMAEAIKLDRRIAKGEYVGPFAGVPVGLKDFLPSKKGWSNTHGGVHHLRAIDDGDSTFYSAARKLGAIAIGKTNAPPFGFKGTCDNKLYGPTKNPFNYKYNSGGSSGGTASAVGAGLIPIGEGGDAGGSIRIPSSWCNCFGFKASKGTIPLYCRPDGFAATHPFCVNGAITRTVLDSATILNELAVYDPRDPNSLPINSNKNFVDLMNKPVKGMKVGFTYDFDLFPVDSEVKRVIEKAVNALTLAGIEVEPVRFHWKHSLEDIASCWSWSISVDTAIDLNMWKYDGLDLVKDHRDELTEEFIYWNEIAYNAGVSDFREFNEIRTDILDNFEDVFDEYDAILSPATCCPPITNDSDGYVEEIGGIKLNEKTNTISFCQTFLVNFIGYPSASVPAGLTGEGLPIGLQITGKQYRDEDVLAISRAYEEVNPWDSLYNISYGLLKMNR